MRRLCVTLFQSSAAAALLLAPAVWAADVTPAPAPNGAGSTQLQEIVITATRQAQNINKVAESVTAFNQQAMDLRGVQNIKDISRLTPGIEFNANGFGTQAEISIRGISSPLVGAATTGIYIDDTPIQARNVGYSATNTYPLVFDLDRVEVLRGPQGTLFGAGSEGGTIRFITPQPSLTTYSVYAKGQVADTEDGAPSYETGVAVGGPIVKDKLGFRASYWAQHTGGFVDRMNLNPELDNPRTFENANWSDTQVARVALTFAPTPQLTITPSLFWQDRWLNDIGTFWESASDPAKGKFINGQPLAQPDHDEFVLPALKIQYEFNGATLISDTSMFQRKDALVDDYSTLVPAIFAGANFIPGSPGYASYAEMTNKQTVYTEELRLQNNNPASRLNWVTGLFLSESIQKAYETIVDPNFGDVTEYAYGLTVEEALGQPLINDTYSLWANGKGVDKQAALFGQVDWNVTDQVRLTGGLRVARASFTGSSFATGPFVGDTITQPPSTVTETPVTPKVGITWQPNNHDLFYATASKGYRIGGTNAPLSTFCDIAAQGYQSVPPGYSSDSVWSYEAGAKTRFDDAHLQINSSIYHINWSNIQQLVYVSNCGQQFVDNLGSAASNGFDIQFSAQPFAGLTLDGAVAYTHATFSRTVNKNPGGALNVVTAGDHLDTQPWSVNLGVGYDANFAGGYDAYVRGDLAYHSGSAILPITNPMNGGYDPQALPAPATTYVSLRGGMRFGHCDLSVFVDNLFNAHPALTRYSEVLGNPIHRDFTFTPLTVGVTGTYRY
jgi:outer membrane receptor protein involved in Fe transport